MAKKHQGYEVAPFPRLRQFIIDSGREAHPKHNIFGLLEIDVTKIRQFIHEHKEKTGESLSLTAFVIACLGRAVESNKYVHAYRNWRNQLIIFEDVDVLTYIEIEGEGSNFREKPVVVEGNIEIRDCLNLTASFDHDLVDGAPAARFIEEFKELIESSNEFA